MIYQQFILHYLNLNLLRYKYSANFIGLVFLHKLQRHIFAHTVYNVYMHPAQEVGYSNSKPCVHESDMLLNA